jgi:hypothetical protein
MGKGLWRDKRYNDWDVITESDDETVMQKKPGKQGTKRIAKKRDKDDLYDDEY